jgi:hypothetical protein
MTQWILYDISDRKESRNGNEEYFIVSFFNTETKEKASTYITIGYRNNDWWGEPIVNNVFGIYTFKPFKSKLTNKYGLIINGDSIPHLVASSTQKEAKQMIDILRS